MFAIVVIAKKQYIVSQNDVITVPHLEGAVGDTMTFNEVLLTSDEKGKVSVGKPTVKGKKITAKIVEQAKGEKMYVRRYKSKVRYRRTRGVRPVITRLEITAIS